MARTADKILDGMKMPDGWTLIGEGSYRTAYLAPDGLVYKVQHDTDAYNGGPSENEEEFMNYSKNSAILKASEGKCRLARSRYFRSVNVIAMEYVPMGKCAYTDPEDIWSNATDEAEPLIKILQRFDFYDHAPANLWFDTEGILTMVDYAC